jgi:hypothetical protein
MEQYTEIISLTKENYKQYLPITAIAFSVAEGGAMGCPGRVVIIDEKSNVYDFYLHEMGKDDVMKILPALYESKRAVLGIDPSASGWNRVYLGMGNHLMVADSIYERFNEFAKALWQSRGSLYQKWMGVVQDILCSKQM